MKLGIMQPYLFPYIGYFQLLNSVDQYVIYDEAQYIRQGFINRNRLLGDTMAQQVPYFQFSVGKSPQTDSIQRKQYISLEADKKKLLERISFVYKKAPFYRETTELVRDVSDCSSTSVSVFNTCAIKKIASYLDMNTQIIVSSGIEDEKYKEAALKCQDLVLHICKYFQASEYVNAIGGTGLYDRNVFQYAGISLRFLKTNEMTYRQFGDRFIPNLSILDVLMFNSREEVKYMLGQYSYV